MVRVSVPPVVLELSIVLRLVGHSLQPNGLRVLSLIPGLIPAIVGKQLDKLAFVSLLPEDEGVLAESDAPSILPQHFGHGMMGVGRGRFNQTLVEVAQKHGVKIVWGHQLVAFEQHDDNVEVTFADGATDTASFVVGCDGLHSNTRIALFGKEQASFTGLTQVGFVCCSLYSQQLITCTLSFLRLGVYLAHPMCSSRPPQ